MPVAQLNRGRPEAAYSFNRIGTNDNSPQYYSSGDVISFGRKNQFPNAACHYTKLEEMDLGGDRGMALRDIT